MKTTITLGLIADKHVVLKDPSIDTQSHIDFIRDLTLKKGVIKSGKTSTSIKEAIVLHSTKGLLKKRVF